MSCGPRHTEAGLWTREETRINRWLQQYSNLPTAHLVYAKLLISHAWDPIYFSAVNYLTPKWGSTAAELEQFALRSVERTRSIEGDGLYARIYIHAAEVEYKERLFLDSRVDWSKMKKSMDDVLDRYPDNWNFNRFARFACLAHDREKTAELMAQMASEPIKILWGTAGLFERCQSLALASAG